MNINNFVLVNEAIGLLHVFCNIMSQNPQSSETKSVGMNGFAFNMNDDVPPNPDPDQDDENKNINDNRSFHTREPTQSNAKLIQSSTEMMPPPLESPQLIPSSSVVYCTVHNLHFVYT